MNIQIMLIAHGDFANILLQTASDITGRSAGIMAKKIDRSEGLEKIKREIDRVVNKIPSGTGLLILTDMLGGTPSNICLPFLEPGKVEVITGVNFPMVITAIHEKDKIKDLKEFSQVVESAGKKGIISCSGRVDK